MWDILPCCLAMVWMIVPGEQWCRDRCGSGSVTILLMTLIWVKNLS